VTGLVSNTHLLDETTPEMALLGFEVAREAARRAGLPVVFAAAVLDVADRLDPAALGCPVLAMERRLLPPHLVRERV
jgi:hypothetical protein